MADRAAVGTIPRMSEERPGDLPLPPRPARDDAVDLLRGIVMVVMALDHARDFFGDLRLDPTDLGRTTPALFFTRWITHFCAPVFVLLAGAGARLSLFRGRSRGSLARLLVTRGAWLVVLEVTLVGFGWSFDATPSFLVLQVIWAIGASMVLLAPLVLLPPRAVGLLGLAIVAGHNVLDGLRSGDLGPFAGAWRLLHEHVPVTSVGGVFVFNHYPLLAWFGVLAIGYGFGDILRMELAARRRVLLLAGLLATGAFVALRVSNLYGDPHPWSAQGSTLLTVLSFLNCEKYPPSLLYLLMTLGPALLALSAFGLGQGKLARPFVVFGRVPLFYYLLHVPLIHVMAAAVSWREAGAVMLEHPGAFPRAAVHGLGGVYLAWLVAVALLYPACRWFAGVKARVRSPWLSYL